MNECLMNIVILFCYGTTTKPHPPNILKERYNFCFKLRYDAGSLWNWIWLTFEQTPKKGSVSLYLIGEAAVWNFSLHCNFDLSVSAQNASDRNKKKAGKREKCKALKKNDLKEQSSQPKQLSIGLCLQTSSTLIKQQQKIMNNTRISLSRMAPKSREQRASGNSPCSKCSCPFVEEETYLKTFVMRGLDFGNTRGFDPEFV
uniref:Uncharacterized protein n=1 Tax=Glossina morsitans morsitans TaxID=37546 RepID=A0A1B0G4E8_GLOMM